MDDSRYPDVDISLDAEEASTVAAILLRLAALIDPTDPDGLRNAHGAASDRLAKHTLTDEQFVMLRKPLYARIQRNAIATRLRIISAKIEGQLPDEAPEVAH